MSISIHLVYKASFKFNSIQFCLAWEVCMWIATRFFVGLIRSPSTQSNDHIHSINIPHHTKLYYILNITYTFHKHSLPYKTIPHTKHNISIPYHTKLFHIDPIYLPHHTKLHHTILKTIKHPYFTTSPRHYAIPHTHIYLIFVTDPMDISV